MNDNIYGQVPHELIVAEMITGQADSQRQGQQTAGDEIEDKVSLLVNSAQNLELPVYVLVNRAAVDPVAENLSIVPISNMTQYGNLSLYYLRWKMAYDFIQLHPEIEWVTLVDATDVEVQKNPFTDMKPATLYMGDELRTFDELMIFGDPNPDYLKAFFAEYPKLQLLNPGVLGGDRDTVMRYLGIMISSLTKTQFKVATNDDHYQLGSYEMALMNYVAYRYFANQLVHGRQVATKFQYDLPNDDSWFKHK